MEMLFALIFIIAFFALMFNAGLVFLQIGIVIYIAWWILKLIVLGIKAIISKIFDK